jgi:hypothetical protein
MTHTSEHGIEHRESWALLPWYVNARLGERDRRRVDAHLGTCAECREELGIQRQVHESLVGEGAVEHMPAASLKRLLQKIDALEPSSPATAAPVISVATARRNLPWHGMIAASMAVMAVALSIVAFVSWTQIARRARPAEYYTVTTASPHASREIIRAVFAPTMTVAELQYVLQEAQLKIIAGPSEAGVYSLAAASDRAPSRSLEILRAHAAVRFAEATEPSSAVGESR